MFIMQALVRLFERLAHQHRMHRELQQLSELDDRLLRDIGVRREDIAHAERDISRVWPEQ